MFRVIENSNNINNILWQHRFSLTLTARDVRTTKQIHQYSAYPKRQRKAPYKVIRVWNARSELWAHDSDLLRYISCKKTRNISNTRTKLRILLKYVS